MRFAHHRAFDVAIVRVALFLSLGTGLVGCGAPADVPDSPPQEADAGRVLPGRGGGELKDAQAPEDSAKGQQASGADASPKPPLDAGGADVLSSRDVEPSGPDRPSSAAPDAAPAPRPAPGSTTGVRSPGCGKSAPVAAGSVSKRTLMVGPDARTYVLSVPTSYDGQTPVRLVYGFHGGGPNTGSSSRSEFGLEKPGTGSNGALFVYPNAINVPRGDGSWWADHAKELRYVDALHEELRNTFCIDERRVFATGISSGSSMAADLACLRGDIVRAVAPVAGLGPSEAWIPEYRGKCKGSPGVMHVFGTRDPGAANLLKSRDLYAARNGCGSGTVVAYAPTPCVAYPGCQAPFVSCVGSGGHSWPGFAGQAIWNFFSSFE